MYDSTWRLGTSCLIFALALGLYGCGSGTTATNTETAATDANETEANETEANETDANETGADETVASDDTPAVDGEATATDEEMTEEQEPSAPVETETAVPESSEKTDPDPTDANEPDTTAPGFTGVSAVLVTDDDVVVLGSGDLLNGIPGDGDLSVEEIEAHLADEKNHVALKFELPFGLHKGATQLGNAFDPTSLTRAKIELGRQLYFDRRLSADGTVSCADCHHPDEGYARHTQFGVGIGGQEGGRNSPVSYNRILSAAQFWDGRAGSLEEQAVGPIAADIEMGNTHEKCVETLQGIEGYRIQFEKIFSGELSIEQVGQAIAAFERCIVTGPSPFDYAEQLATYDDVDLEDLKEDDPDLYEVYEKVVADAEAHPMSEEANRGMKAFFSDKVGCSACHVGANLTDEKYHNLGIGMDKEEPDVGRQAVTGEEKDTGGFKTPTIRNVELSAPYMHDGTIGTLEEVVEWYSKGGHANPHLSEKIKKLDLPDQDKKDLVAFMKACTGPFPSVERARLPQ